MQLVTEAQRQALSSLKQASELSVRAAEAAAGLVSTDDGVRSPTPHEVVETSYGFAGEILEIQKAYALRLADLAGAATQNAAPKPPKQS